MVIKNPTYPLAEIKADVANPTTRLISRTARKDSVCLGMNENDIVSVVQDLSSSNFIKTMIGKDDPRIMHDVYKYSWRGIRLYLKFIRNHGATNIMVVSCKEDTSHV